MALKNFIKENLALTAGIALPVLLMLFFVLSTMIPQGVVEPPKYDLVFSVDDYSGSQGNGLGVDFAVQDNVLKVQYTHKDKDSYYMRKRLYYFKSSEKSVREITPGLPADSDKINGTVSYPVAETSGKTIDTRLESPDGFTMNYDGYSRSGLFNDMFGGGYRYRNQLRLIKGSGSIAVKAPEGTTPFYYNQAHFIGWVTP